MFNGFSVDWFWRPVGVGRHAFGVKAKQLAPDSAVVSFCGVEVQAWQVQRLPPESEWIAEDTCMKCWRLIAKRFD
ncbi:zinc finger protein [Saccharopolyspora pogona]|uniref:zinc finger protein n=1 Tax=Saccharopolyspora pogona TaxID=333966 RepID=UPI0016838598|nr:zinc finger protein [Saccharopolyspora pogona]